MKRKYFSRGLGLGILVTALLFAFGLLFYKPSLSDEEIKARATLLGMTETSDRKTSSETSAASSSASSSAAASSATSATPSSSAEPETSATSAEPTVKTSEEPAPVQPEPSKEEPSQPEPSEPTPTVPDTPSEPTDPDVPGGNPGSDDPGLLSVTIYPQDSSLKVSENLYRAGIIDDPVSFNRYLESNGYDYNIQTGTFWISPNASYDTIAHAITNL